jgi:hypothetical protein
MREIIQASIAYIIVVTPSAVCATCKDYGSTSIGKGYQQTKENTN